MPNRFYSIGVPADTTSQVQPPVGLEQDGDPIEKKTVS
jgi:hypothetical protein